MAYTKKTWQDRSVEFPRRYLDELGAVKTFTPNEGTVYAAGTPVTAADMNNLETGVGQGLWYGPATGAANTYAVALDPVPDAYAEGMTIRVKINVESTGASTININSLGAKTIKKANWNDIAAGSLKAGSIYTLTYDGTNFILQGDGGSGDAVAADVLSGKKCSTDAGDITGSMPNRAGDTACLSSSVNGTTLKLLASNGYRDGVDDNVIITDANFIAANILAGKNIFGISGTARRFASGSGTSTAGGGSFVRANDGYSVNYSKAVISGLLFTPSIIIVVGAGGGLLQNLLVMQDTSGYGLMGFPGSAPLIYRQGGDAYLGTTSQLAVYQASTTFSWYAWE